MELFEKEVIFSMSFPKVDVSEIDEETQKILEAVSETRSPAPRTAKEMLEHYYKKYAYTPRAGAEQRTKEIISCATKICKDYEIDTEITKEKYWVNVSMNIGFGWFGGSIKRALGKLIGMADDISTFSRKSDPDALVIVMTYYTHICSAEEE